MKYFVILFLFGTAQAQTMTTTTQTIREETTIVTVTQNGNTTTQSSVPIVQRANVRSTLGNCNKPPKTPAEISGFPFVYLNNCL